MGARVENRETWERLASVVELAEWDGRSVRFGPRGYALLAGLGTVMMTVGWIAVGCSVAR